jgi:hypothetical protein
MPDRRHPPEVVSAWTAFVSTISPHMSQRQPCRIFDPKIELIEEKGILGI